VIASSDSKECNEALHPANSLARRLRAPGAYASGRSTGLKGPQRRPLVMTSTNVPHSRLPW
jgi:hypothetical protein